MKNMKSIIAITLATLTAITAVPTTTYAQGYDTTAPTISLVNTDKRNYTAGETVYLSMLVCEEETGIDYASVYFTNKYTNDVVKMSADLSNNQYTGYYDSEYTIPESMLNGQWTITSMAARDKAGNEWYVMPDSNLVNINIEGCKEVADEEAPVLTSVSVEKEELTTSDTQNVIIECHDADLSSIEFNVYSNRIASYNIYKRVDITEIAEDGIYTIPVEFEDNYPLGSWSVGSIGLGDGINGTIYGIATEFTLTDKNGNTEDNMDTVSPVISNVYFEKTELIIPGSTKLHIVGTDEGNSENVSAAITLYNGVDREKFFRGSSKVNEDGSFDIAISINANNTYTAGRYTLAFAHGADDNGNEFDCSSNDIALTLKNDIEVEAHTSLSNPNITEVIKSVEDYTTVLINCDITTAKAEIFEAIIDTNKTLVFDMNGIQWIFNGSTVKAENCKDIELRFDITEKALEAYGYDDTAKGVVLDFAANGTLPGTATVRIKKDYIYSTYNLTEELFLAFIKETVDVEEEVVVGQNFIYPVDEDGNNVYYTKEYIYDEAGNPMYYKAVDPIAATSANATPVNGSEKEYDTETTNWITEEQYNELLTTYGYVMQDENYQLYYISFIDPEIVDIIETINYQVEQETAIEDAVYGNDDNYVTIELTHNSSYVLSNRLPLATSASNSASEEVENRTPVTNDEVSADNTVEPVSNNEVVVPASETTDNTTPTNSNTEEVVPVSNEVAPANNTEEVVDSDESTNVEVKQNTKKLAKSVTKKTSLGKITIKNGKLTFTGKSKKQVYRIKINGKTYTFKYKKTIKIKSTCNKVFVATKTSSWKKVVIK